MKLKFVQESELDHLPEQGPPPAIATFFPFAAARACSKALWMPAVM